MTKTICGITKAGSAIALFTLIILSSDVNGHDCIFDEVETKQATKTWVNYRAKGSYRRRRGMPQFEPIRISPFFHEIGKQLDDQVSRSLKYIVEVALNRIRCFLKVVPVRGRLLLSRSACKSKYAAGPNKGRCSTIRPGYLGEFCLDNFKIPDEHLTGVKVWDATVEDLYSEPIRPGNGVSNADFILYVTSFTDLHCQTRDVLAYASYCSLDQNDRPIAGYVNFCPSQVNRYINNEDHNKIYMITLHEMFHMLGFSKRLFSRFRDCSKSVPGYDCARRTADIFKSVEGVLRMTTPAVINHTRKHFSCDRQFDFGAAINIEARLTYIDEMSVAVLEDTGWYSVSYSSVNDYPWGKGQGCDFGMPQTCARHWAFFCQGTGGGCDLTHSMKASCATTPTLQPCRIYKPNPNDSCAVTPTNMDADELAETGEEYGCYSFCLRSNLSLQGRADIQTSGRCYKLTCTHGDKLYVSVNSSWVECPLAQTIQVDGYHGYIECPRRGIICQDLVSPSPTPDMFNPELVTKPIGASISSGITEYNGSTTSTPPWDPAPNFLVKFVLINRPYSFIREQRLESGLIDAVRGMMMGMGVARHRMRDFLVTEGSILMSFTLLPSKDPQEGPPSAKVISKLSHDIEKRNVEVKVNGYILRLVDVSYIELSHSPNKLAPPATIQIPVLIGVIASIVLCVVLMVLIRVAINTGRIKCSCVYTRTGVYRDHRVMSESSTDV